MIANSTVSRRERDKHRRYTSYTASSRSWDSQEENKENQLDKKTAAKNSTETPMVPMEFGTCYLKKKPKENEDVGLGGLARALSSEGLADAGSSQPVRETTPITYRGVRSLKHKNDKSYQEGLRKSNSMQDLASADKDDTVQHDNLYRSRSRENLYDSFPRRRPVSERLNSDFANNTDPHDPEQHISSDPAARPKTLFESLRESLLNPEPPKPKPKNSRYLRLAGIPQTRPIENYVGSQPEPKAPPRRRSAPATDLLRTPTTKTSHSAHRWSVGKTTASPIPSRMDSLHTHSAGSTHDSPPPFSRLNRKSCISGLKDSPSSSSSSPSYHASLPQEPPQRSISTPSAQKALFGDPTEPVPPPRGRKSEEKTSTALYRTTPSTSTFLYNGRNKNETDEHKVSPISFWHRKYCYEFKLICIDMHVYLID